MRNSVRIVYYIFSATLIFATAEIGSFAAMTFLRNIGPARFLFYSPPKIEPEMG